MATIACVDVDPLLADLVRRVRPGDEVVEVTADELQTSRPSRWGAVVMSAGSAALGHVDGSPLAERTVLIGVARATHPGPVLRRPVDGSDLRTALSRILRPDGRVAALRSYVRELPQSVGAPGLLVIARATSVAAAVVLDAVSPFGVEVSWAVALVLAWAAVRIPLGRLSVPLVSFDVVVALAVVVVTGGATSPYLLVGAVVASEVGFAFPPRPGAVLVGVASLAGVAQLVTQVLDGRAQALDLIAFGALIPLASLAGGMGARIVRSRDDDHLRTLRQLNQTLDRLSRQAQEMAGSLSVLTVSEAFLDTVREEFGAVAAVLLLDDTETQPSRVRTVAGAFGLKGAPPQRVLDESGSTREIPTEIVAGLPAGDRMVTRLVAGGVERGLLVVVLDPNQRARGVGRRLEDLADEVALALDNARVFEGIRSLTLDAERRRVARDLHDGVVQSLVHVGFELDLLAGQLDEGDRAEATRLRGVVGQAVDEVRGVVQGLRSVRLADGLAPALAALAREYSNGVTVEVETSPVDGLPPEAELQLLRIAQEAVSNAVQHASPTRVDVLFWATRDDVHLQVSDNGVGMAAREVGGKAGRGVGLQAMQERADLLGASLSVEPGVQGGTCVRVEIPWGRIRS